ncbi:MAG: hypothetical protein AAF667_17185 [Pseudomonadota bacterium]
MDGSKAFAGAVTLTKISFLRGIWEGVLTGPASETWESAPPIEAVHRERTLGGLEIGTEPGPLGWLVRFSVQPEILGDGVQTVIFRVTGTEEVLASLSIVAGTPLEDDIHAEVELLRAELDLLKRSFRTFVAKSE